MIRKHTGLLSPTPVSTAEAQDPALISQRMALSLFSLSLNRALLGPVASGGALLLGVINCAVLLLHFDVLKFSLFRMDLEFLSLFSTVSYAFTMCLI